MWNVSFSSNPRPGAQVHDEKVTNRTDGRQLLRGWWLPGGWREERWGGCLSDRLCTAAKTADTDAARRRTCTCDDFFFPFFFSSRLQCPRGRPGAKPSTISPPGTRKRCCACCARWAKLVASWVIIERCSRVLSRLLLVVFSPRYFVIVLREDSNIISPRARDEQYK